MTRSVAMLAATATAIENLIAWLDQRAPSRHVAQHGGGFDRRGGLHRLLHGLGDGLGEHFRGEAARGLGDPSLAALPLSCASADPSARTDILPGGSPAPRSPVGALVVGRIFRADIPFVLWTTHTEHSP